MTKFNTQKNKIKEALKRPHAIKNLAGGIAYKMDDELRLYTRVLTSLVGEDKFYKSGDKSDKAILVNLKKVDPLFVAGLAVYAREKFYLRSIPVMLLSELSEISKGSKLVGKAIERIIQRPDELTEMLAYRINKYGRTIPHQIKKGLARAFGKFNEYQLAKYNRAGSVKLKDVLFMVHPKPKDKEQDELWKRLINGEMKIPDTWETKISGKGSTKENWEEILKSGNMGIMAVIRNLRNFVEKEVDLKPAIELLTNKEIIHKSKQFPFRFFNAYMALEEIKAPAEILDAVTDAMEFSIDNVPKLEGKTLIAVDDSGSMSSLLSSRGTAEYRHIAALLCAIYHKKNPYGTTIGKYSNDWEVVTLNSRDSVLSNMRKLFGRGGTTNTYKVFDWVGHQKEQFDRIILLSDMQSWDDEYRGWAGIVAEGSVEGSYIKSKHRGYVYSIDLAGYGTSDIDTKNPKIIKLAGWNEKVFNYIQKNEEDKGKVIEEIRNIGKDLID